MKIIIFIFIGMFIAVYTTAQDIIGYLVPDKDGTPIIGAIVQETGTINGTGVDMNGKFSIPVSNTNATLKCSCIGFETVEIAIDGKRDIGIIKMKESVYYLKDVVVSSQMATSKKTPIAATSLTGKEVDERIGIQEFVEVLKYTH